MGAGRSKKEAKHQAAKHLIDKLLDITVTPEQIMGINPVNGNGVPNE